MSRFATTGVAVVGVLRTYVVLNSFKNQKSLLSFENSPFLHPNPQVSLQNKSSKISNIANMRD